MNDDTDDPVSHVARWRPRPEQVECRRPSGALETYVVPAGRRAWQKLRALLPGDAVELVGRRGGNIVGRWQAPTAVLAVEPPTPDVVEYDDDGPPTDDAALVRWVMREMRGVYSDQLRATREILTVMAECMRAQRELVLEPPRAPATPSDDDDDDDPGYGKMMNLLGQAAAVFTMQQQRSSSSSSSPPAPPAPPDITPPRNAP